MNKLSIKQKQVLEAIEYFINQNGYSPTYHELSLMLHSDRKTVFERVLLLERKGYLKTTNGKARSIVVVKKVDD